MMKIGIVGCLCAISLGIIAPRAKADEWSQKTVITFNAPVEMPGKDLPAGTYVFKLADSMADRDIVEVYNDKETHLVGTFLAVPDYRLKPTGKTIITFNERAAGAPEALRAWFYPGDLYGHQFVYPKSKAAQLAKANHQAVPSVEDESASNSASMRKSHLKAQQPTGQEVDEPVAFPAQNNAGKK